jgi:hypothetical protein
VGHPISRTAESFFPTSDKVFWHNNGHASKRTFLVSKPVTRSIVSLLQGDNPLSAIMGQESGEFPGSFCCVETRLSIAALSKSRSSLLACMLSFKPGRRRLSFLVPVHAVILFWLLSNFEAHANDSRFPNLDLQASVCLCLILYSPQNLDFAFLLNQQSIFSILYYILRHLESFISVLPTAFQHALFTFFVGLELGVDNLGRIRCPSRVSSGQKMYQFCIR